MMRAMPRHTAVTGMALAAVWTAFASSATGQDWPQWRGANRDGAVTAFTEPVAWPDRLTERWTVEVGFG